MCLGLMGGDVLHPLLDVSSLRWRGAFSGVFLLALVFIRPPAGGRTGLLILIIDTREETPYLTIIPMQDRCGGGGRAFASHAGDRGSIPGRDRPMTISAEQRSKFAALHRQW